MPFNLGPVELIFVMVVLLLVFGAKRLPELGSGLGKGIREFKRSVRDMNDEIHRPEAPKIQDPVRGHVAPPQGASVAPPQGASAAPSHSEAARQPGAEPIRHDD
jgi:sec-independent protein translocase protein TatA